MGRRAAVPDAAAASPDIPGFRPLRLLGRGASATVLLAQDLEREREVALKLVPLDRALDAGSLDALLAAARRVAATRHPNLMQLHAVGVRDGVLYAASEYLPGGALAARMTGQPLPVARALAIACDIARGLQALHRRGIVHRDVKPGNILFRANGEAVLGDFGLARALGPPLALPELADTAGTPAYMSPEQREAAPLDARSDLYSLGVVLWEMLAGALPSAPGHDPLALRAVVTQDVPALPPTRRWLQPLVDGLMAVRVEDRFTDAGAFLQAVGQLLTAAPEAVAVLDTGRKAPRQRRRRLWPWLAVLLGLLLAGGWLAWRGVAG